MPETLWTPVLRDLQTWSGIADLTAGEVLDYALFIYGDLRIEDFPLTLLTIRTQVWTEVNRYRFTTLARTTQQDYSPIENYNRTEESTSSTSSERTPDLSRARAVDMSTTENDTTTTTGTAETAGDVVPFDISTYSPEAKSTSSTGGTETKTGRSTEGGTVTERETGTDTTEGSTKASSFIHGNIGVTTTQNMLRQEREISNFAFLDLYLTFWASRFTQNIFS